MSDIVETYDEPRPWTNGIIKYYFDGSLSIDQIYAIQQGMLVWAKNTNLSFVEVFPDKNALKISVGDMCKSSIGCQKNNHLILSIFTQRKVLHELGHAIGLRHEHQRMDRDNFIIVNYENILKFKNDFDKAPQFYNINNYDYDYESIMHYPSFAYTNNFIKPTITKSDGSIIYEHDVLTKDDIKKVNEIYK
jgi:hypothetical protein